LVIVVSAPSGTGKTTVCGKLLADMTEMRRSVSFTTRRPRKGEKEGQHYHFVTRKQFQEERDKGRFVECAEVHGYLYGTPRDFLEKRLRAGKDTVLVIDVQGARAIKESFPEAVLIFLLPPSFEELKRRLKMRGRVVPEDVDLRLRNAAAEFSCYRAYDYLVVNDDVAEAAEILRAIITAERCRASRLNPESSPKMNAK
jgi:guanylate kinase